MPWRVTVADRIEINFTANSAEVDEAAKRIGQDLTDTQKSLDKVGQAGVDAGSDASRGLGDVATAAKSTGTTIDEEVGGGFTKAGKTGSDVISGVKTGLLGAAGIAGGVAGTIGSAVGSGISALIDLATESNKQWEKVKQGITDAYKEAAEQGATALSQAQIVSASIDILNDSGRKQEAVDAAKKIGVDLNTYIRAQAGSYEDLQAVVIATKKTEADRQAQLDEAGKRGTQFGDAEVVELEKIRKKNEELLQVSDAGVDNAKRAQDIKDGLAKKEQQNQKDVADTTLAKIQDIKQATDGIPPEKVIKVTTDTSAADAAIAKFVTKPRNFTISARVVDRYGKDII